MDEPRTKNSGWMRSARAIAEVTLAFAAMRVLFRSFKRFTATGQVENLSGLNFSPGIAMMIVAFAFIAMRRQSPAAYGFGDLLVRMPQLLHEHA